MSLSLAADMRAVKQRTQQRALVQTDSADNNEEIRYRRDVV